MSVPLKIYLGDAVYAELDDCDDVVLKTSNGLATTNRIVLEPAVLKSLLDWLKALERQQERRK